MASSGGVDIQIVSMPNLQKIEKFMRDSSYRETLELSASFNTRLCVDRRMRLPFFDSQTGVAQNHNRSLYVAHCKRMPGHREGQLYTYPASRWRKSKRQYLTKLQNLRPFSNLKAAGGGSTNVSVGISVPAAVVREPGEIASEQSDFNATLLEESSMGATGDTDSKDSHQNSAVQSKEEPLPKDWYYDEMALNDDDLDDGEGGDSDYDYNVNGYKRKGKKSKRSSGAGRRSRSNQTATAASAASADFDAAGSPGGSSSRKGRSAASSGTKRGRKRNAKESTTVSADKGLEDSLNESLAEPPSFDSVAAAVDFGENGENGAGFGGNTDLRNYRKYL
ncbi:zinc finger protein ubi-d4 A [Culex pipiens pallens]|uniref:zinc finger protein ubi-d4 A n=1 Tax=Culex pipiens pallens TaxID=42434 RepID=UPI00195485D8|nr:zinc finger protein ubi-d4 A [Culex pipiens pallens]